MFIITYNFYKGKFLLVFFYAKKEVNMGRDITLLHSEVQAIIPNFKKQGLIVKITDKNKGRTR